MTRKGKTMSRIKDLLEEKIDSGEYYYDEYLNEYKPVVEARNPKIIYLKNNNEITKTFVGLDLSELEDKEMDLELLITRGVLNRNVTVDNDEIHISKKVSKFQWDKADPSNPASPNFVPYKWSLSLEDNNYNRRLAKQLLRLEYKEVLEW